MSHAGRSFVMLWTLISILCGTVALLIHFLSGASAQTGTRGLIVLKPTVGTTAASVDGARLRTQLQLLNQSATATIYCTIDGTTPVAAATAGQITLPPLAGSAWTTGLVPNNAIQCIASAAGTPMTIIE